MATKLQRAKTIIDALADPAVPDVAMLDKIADAFAYTYRRGEMLTNAQRAGIFIRVVREFVKKIVLESGVSQDEAAARPALISKHTIDIGNDE